MWEGGTHRESWGLLELGTEEVPSAGAWHISIQQGRAAQDTLRRTSRQPVACREQRWGWAQAAPSQAPSLTTAARETKQNSAMLAKAVPWRHQGVQGQQQALEAARLTPSPLTHRHWAQEGQVPASYEEESSIYRRAHIHFRRSGNNR